MTTKISFQNVLRYVKKYLQPMELPTGMYSADMLDDVEPSETCLCRVLFSRILEQQRIIQRLLSINSFSGYCEEDRQPCWEFCNRKHPNGMECSECRNTKLEWAKSKCCLSKAETDAGR